MHYVSFGYVVYMITYGFSGSVYGATLFYRRYSLFSFWIDVKSLAPIFWRILSRILQPLRL